jgi:hypothetical protein
VSNLDIVASIPVYQFVRSDYVTNASLAVEADPIWTNDRANGFSVGGSILPAASNAYDLGSAAVPWRDLFVDTNTIHLGASTLSITPAGNLSVNGVELVQKGVGWSGTLTNVINDVTQTLEYVDGLLLDPRPHAAVVTYAPDGGEYTDSVEVVLSSTNADPIYYYTTDGSAPTTNSSVTTNAGVVTLADPYTNSILAFATFAGHSDSPVSTSAVFTVIPTVPVGPLQYVTNSTFDTGMGGWSGENVIWDAAQQAVVMPDMEYGAGDLSWVIGDSTNDYNVDVEFDILLQSTGEAGWGGNITFGNPSTGPILNLPCNIGEGVTSTNIHWTTNVAFTALSGENTQFQFDLYGLARYIMTNVAIDNIYISARP